MLKHYQKFIFLFIVLAAAFIARAAYPNIAPSKNSQTSVVTTGDTPPLLVLASPGTPDGTATITGNTNPSSEDTANSTPATASGAAISLFRHTGTADVPSLPEQAYLVADLTSGTIFAGVNADKRWPTASLTKLMTASIAADNLDPTARVTITPDIFAADPQEITLVPGGTYTVADLMRVLLLPSSNVAAEALASLYGRTAFMEAMNARATGWGMKNSFFDDPSGISAANESTANDMLVLAQHIYNDYPSLLAITRTPQVMITELNHGTKVPVKSINNFAGQTDFIGGKTGHTNEAEGNLLSIFRYSGHPLLIVVLGTENRFIDTTNLYRWFRQNFI